MKKIYCQACKQYYEIDDHLSASSYTCMKCQGPLVDAPVAVPVVEPTNTGGAVAVAIVQRPPKSRLAYCILALFFGGLGIHNFYSGHNKQGLIKLVLTLLLGWTIVVPLGIFIWILIEIVTVNADSEGRPFDNKLGCLGIGAILLLIALFMTPLLAIPAAMFLPALSQAHERARHISCVSNFKQLGVAYLMYCDDNNDMPPTTLEQLFEYVGDDDVFRCPSVASEDGRPSYRMVVYPVTYNKMRNPSAAPIIIERLGNHRNGINVCYADGHVEYKATQADNYQALLPCFPNLDSATQAALERLLRQWDAEPDW